MHHDDRSDDQIVDLGDIVAETKGGSQNGNDTILQPRQMFIELADD